MPTPEIKDYSKPHLRAVLANPNIDTRDETILDTAKKRDKRIFQKQVYPIVDVHCKKIMSLEDFKKSKTVPHPIVKIIFQKLL